MQGIGSTSGGVVGRCKTAHPDPESWDGTEPHDQLDVLRSHRDPDSDLPSDRIEPSRRCRYCGTVNCTKTTCIAIAGHDRRKRATANDEYGETLAASILRDLVLGWHGNQNVADQFIHSLHQYIDARVEVKLRGVGSETAEMQDG